MTDITVSRSGTSVTIEALEDGGGNPLVSRDVGKPNLEVSSVGFEDPITNDSLSSQSLFTVVGRLTGSSAYSDAKTLAESIIKPRLSTGTPVQLDLSNLPNRSTYDTAPSQQQSLVLTYPPGMRNNVQVQLTLQEGENFFGGSLSTQSYGSPDSGSGVKFDDGTNTVTLSSDLEVKRTVGRPATEAKATTNELPDLDDKSDPASDVFELTGQFTGANSESDTKTLEETIIRQQYGYGELDLHFLDNLYSLDKYPVMPDGSQALRTSFQSADTGVVPLDTLKFRVVNQA